MNRLLSALILAAMSVLPLSAAHADTFTPQQRQEIVEIIRNALKTDPSILRDAVAQLQKDNLSIPVPSYAPYYFPSPRVKGT